MPSLSLKASINYPVIGGPSGPTYDTDANDWFNAVSAAGASISSANKDVFNNCILDLKGILPSSVNNPSSLNIWQEITMAGFLCGFDSFSGCFVPMKGNYSTTNNNFTSTDYQRTIGLTGDGASKTIGLGVTATNMGAYQNRHHLATITGFPSNDIQNLVSGTYFLGCGTAPSYGLTAETDSTNGGATIGGRFLTNSTPSFLPRPSLGLTPLSIAMYRNGSNINQTFLVSDLAERTGSGGAITGSATASSTWSVFGRTSGSSFTTATLGYYSLGGMSTTILKNTNNLRVYMNIVKTAIQSLT
jgi:hypothetical protein